MNNLRQYRVVETQHTHDRVLLSRKVVWRGEFDRPEKAYPFAQNHFMVGPQVTKRNDLQELREDGLWHYVFGGEVATEPEPIQDGDRCFVVVSPVDNYLTFLARDGKWTTDRCQAAQFKHWEDAEQYGKFFGWRVEWWAEAVCETPSLEGSVQIVYHPS